MNDLSAQQQSDEYYLDEEEYEEEVSNAALLNQDRGKELQSDQQMAPQHHQQYQQQQQYDNLVESDSSLGTAGKNNLKPSQQQMVRPQTAVPNTDLRNKSQKPNPSTVNNRPQSAATDALKQKRNTTKVPQGSNQIVLDGRTNAESGHPIVTEDSDLNNTDGNGQRIQNGAAFDSLTFKSRHSQATSFFLSQAQANQQSILSEVQQELSETQLKVKSQRTQLTFLLNENDGLKEQITQLQQALEQAQTALSEATQDAGPDIQNLVTQNRELQEELITVTEARDQAQKKVLLCRQLSIIFQHREENVDQALVDSLWESELRHESKDNLISEQNKTIENLRQKLKSQQQRVVVDNYIIGPSMIVLDLQKKVEKASRREKNLFTQIDQLNARMREVNLKLEMKTNEFKMQETMQKVSEEQMDQLRKHIETLSRTNAQKVAHGTAQPVDQKNFKQIQKLLMESEKRKEEQIRMLHERQMSQKFELQQMIEQAQKQGGNASKQQSSIQAQNHTTVTKLEVTQEQPAWANNQQEQAQGRIPPHKQQKIPKPVPVAAKNVSDFQPILPDMDDSDSSRQDVVDRHQQYEQPSQSDRFSQRVFMEKTHDKHKDTIPQLDLSVVTGHQTSFIAPKSPQVQKPHKPNVQKQPLAEEPFNFEPEPPAHHIIQPKVGGKKPPTAKPELPLNLTDEMKKEIRNANKIGSSDSSSVPQRQNQPIQVQKQIPMEPSQPVQADFTHQQPMATMPQAGITDNLLEPSDGGSSDAGKTDERLEQQRKNLFRMSSTHKSNITGEGPQAHTSSLPGLLTSQDSNLQSGKRQDRQGVQQQQQYSLRQGSGQPSDEQVIDDEVEVGFNGNQMILVKDNSVVKSPQLQGRVQAQEVLIKPTRSVSPSKMVINKPSEDSFQLESDQEQPQPSFMEDTDQFVGRQNDQQQTPSAAVGQRQPSPLASGQQASRQQLIEPSKMFSPGQQQHILPTHQTQTPGSATEIQFPPSSSAKQQQEPIMVNVGAEPEAHDIGASGFDEQEQEQPSRDQSLLKQQQQRKPTQNSSSSAADLFDLPGKTDQDASSVAQQQQQIELEPASQPVARKQPEPTQIVVGQQMPASYPQQRQPEPMVISVGGNTTAPKKPQPQPVASQPPQQAQMQQKQMQQQQQTTAPTVSKQHQQQVASTGQPQPSMTTTLKPTQPAPTQITIKPASEQVGAPEAAAAIDSSDDDGFGEPVFEQATGSAAPEIVLVPASQMLGQQASVQVVDQSKEKKDEQKRAEDDMSNLIIEEEVESEAENVGNGKWGESLVFENNDDNVQINITTGAENSQANNTSAMNNKQDGSKLSIQQKLAQTQPINAAQHNRKDSTMPVEMAGAGKNQSQGAGKDQIIGQDKNQGTSGGASLASKVANGQGQQTQLKDYTDELGADSPRKNISLNGTQNTVSIIKSNTQQNPSEKQPDAAAAAVDDEYEYGDEYYEEEEEEEEEEKKQPPSVLTTKPQTGASKTEKYETMSNDSMSKIKRIVESQAKIPRIIIIKDAQGIEQEYEVLEESEEEEDVLSGGQANISISRSGTNIEQNLKIVNKGQPAAQMEDGMSSRRRVLIEGDGNLGDESFYIEEIIEESEEESDEMDNFGIGQSAASGLSAQMQQTQMLQNKNYQF